MSGDALQSLLACLGWTVGRDPTPLSIGGRGEGAETGSPPTPSQYPLKTISENAT